MTTLSDYQRRLQAFWTQCAPDQTIPALRHLARTDLYFLLRYALNRKDVEHQWLFDRCEEVQAAPDGYLDLWSREHYKSAIITYAKTIQDILASHGDGAVVGREVCVGIFSHTRGIAKRFLRQIKYEFESNDKLKEWFPDVLWSDPHKESPKWSEDDGIVVRRHSNPAEATVEAWGVVDGQPIGKHFPLLVYDDVVTQESTNTPDMLKKTSDMLSLSFALGADGGARRFIGTRYHANDAYKTVIDRGTAKPRIHLLTQDGTADGEPTLRSKEWVQGKRRDMGPFIFACFVAGTKVLDGEWAERDIETLVPGDTVVGYSFGAKTKSALVRSKVVAINNRQAEVVRFTFESGRTVVCTPDHKFFTGRRGAEVGGNDTHRAYAPLGFDKSSLKAAIPVYDPRHLNGVHDAWAAAWLGGIFDGEGAVSANTIQISQSPEHNPQVCERIETVLKALRFDYGTHERAAHTSVSGKRSKAGRSYYLRGGRQEKMRFLHACKPVRGYKIIDALYDGGTRNFGKANRDKLVSIEPLGVQTVYSIQTETGNYIADGYAVKNCQMLQNPTADETQGFKEEWIKYHDGFTREGMNVYLLFDPAGSKNKRSDYTAGWVVGLGPDKNIYILDMVRDRLNLSQRAALVMRWHRKWKPMRTGGVRYEKYGLQADIEHIQSVQKQENYRFDIVEVGGQLSKNDRIKRLIPYHEQGRVYYPRTLYYTGHDGKTTDLVQDFIQQEYKPFPVCVHDDMFDALARLIDPDPELALVWPEEVDYGTHTDPETFDD